MKKILLLHFGGLENYGTGMMGLITITELHRRYKGGVKISCDFANDSTIDDVKSELNDEVLLERHKFSPKKRFSNKLIRVVYNLFSPFSRKDVKQYDEIIILGGDDISEYYVNNIFLEILQYWYWSLFSPVILLGQSIGPFNLKRNRLVAKYFLNRITIIVRDGWTRKYLLTEFRLNKNVYQGADLAFKKLPLQNKVSIKTEALSTYGLEQDKYCTIVISGIQGKYYTNDKEIFFNTYEQIIRSIWGKYDDIQKICLLAHTFPPHANEGRVIEEFLVRFSKEERGRLIAVTSKINQIRSRFILGSGMFTITGRMHAAISTFQMGKPAISLSYSAKYQGVIGINLDRGDLIIESNNPNLWDSGEIVKLVMDRVDYIFNNYETLTVSIKDKVEQQIEIVDSCFDRIINK